MLLKQHLTLVCNEIPIFPAPCTWPVPLPVCPALCACAAHRDYPGRAVDLPCCRKGRPGARLFLLRIPGFGNAHSQCAGKDNRTVAGRKRHGRHSTGDRLCSGTAHRPGRVSGDDPAGKRRLSGGRQFDDLRLRHRPARQRQPGNCPDGHGDGSGYGLR